MNEPAPTVAPHKHFAEILEALDGARRSAHPWSGNSFRLVAVRYATPGEILSGRGSQVFGGRWNAAGTFPSIYCSLLPETAVSALRIENETDLAKYVHE